jgi:hypothetical protein
MRLDRLRQRFARWLLRGAHLDGVTFGESSIAISPAGVGDVLRWSGTKDAVAVGDLGMNVASGLLSVFQTGVARDLLAGRIIGSGSNLIAGATTATLATLTRNANERIVLLGFIQENTAGAAWDPTFAVAAAAIDDVHYWTERTANANEFTVRARNETAATNRTLDWLVIGVIP